MMKELEKDIVCLNWAARVLLPLIPANHSALTAVFRLDFAVSAAQKKAFGIREHFAGKRKNRRGGHVTVDYNTYVRNES